MFLKGKKKIEKTLSGYWKIFLIKYLLTFLLIFCFIKNKTLKMENSKYTWIALSMWIYNSVFPKVRSIDHLWHIRKTNLVQKNHTKINSSKGTVCTNDLFQISSRVGVNCSKFDCSTIICSTLLAGNQLLDTKFINCSNPVQLG